MRTFKVMALVAISCLFVTALFAQEEIPPFYERIFSAELLGYIAAVVATTKLIRNFLGDIKGFLAVVLTVAIGTAIGEFQLGIIGGQGHLIGISAGLAGGLAVAGVFKLTKLAGKVVGLKSENNL